MVFHKPRATGHRLPYTSPVVALHTETLPNGLVLAVEEQPSNAAAAFSLLVPAGATADPEGREGTAAVLERWLWKGAGRYDARGFAEALDDLGVRRGSAAGVEYTTFSAALLPEVLPRVLDLFAAMVLAPRLEDATFESARKAVEEELAALEDDPPRKLFVRLRGEVFQSPHRRNVEGRRESLRALTPGEVRAFFARRYRARGAILAVAGGVRREEVRRAVLEAFGCWGGEAPGLPEPVTTEPHAAFWPEATAQVQIGLYYRDVPPDSEFFYPARLAAQVLSGGMASRLFTEVRERRGLVYTVYASPGAFRGFGYLAAYAGTTPERAEETRRVLKAEIERLSEGVSEEELRRAKIRTKSALVMQSESAQARAGGMVRDLFLLGRARSLEEIAAGVEAVDLAALNDFLARHPYREPWEGVLGPEGTR